MADGAPAVLESVGNDRGPVNLVMLHLNRRLPLPVRRACALLQQGLGSGTELIPAIGRT